MGIKTRINLDRVIAIGERLQCKVPSYSNSFILKAGKCSKFAFGAGFTGKIRLGFDEKEGAFITFWC